MLGLEPQQQVTQVLGELIPGRPVEPGQQLVLRGQQVPERLVHVLAS